MAWNDFVVGSVVRLRAGGEAMLVEEVRPSCDGTGGDGPGLRCSWVEDGRFQEGWISASAVVRVPNT